MAEKGALARLRKEYMRIQKEPVEGVEAAPCESNMLEWHYVVTGPRGSPYEGGKYHGKLIFPPQYPYKPPSIMMTTPSGRFKTNTRLCLSMSDFHPETWNPLWSVSSILSGLLSFMLENARTYGSIESDDDTRRRYAAESLSFNLRDAQFNALFPHYRTQIEQKAKDEADARKAALLASSSTSSSSSSSSVNGPAVAPGAAAAGTTAAAAILAEAKQPLIGGAGAAAAVAGGTDGAVRLNAADKQARALRRDELFDRLIMAILIVTFLFALSYLYT